MKKIISIIAILMLVMGCTSNSEEEPIDSVIGVWKLTSIKTMAQEFINDCRSKDKIEVRQDKTFTINGHNEDDNCAPQTSSGTWSANLTNTYKFSAAGDTQTFTLKNNNTLTFSFVQDGNSIVYSYTKQ